MTSDERTSLLQGLREDEDPDVVSWDGSDDPENPVNWTAGKAWGHVTIVSLLTFLV